MGTINLTSLGVIIVMTGAVITSGLLMVPSKRELANIYFRDKDFVKSRQFYEEEYARGNRTIDVYGALSRIYLQNGEIDHAIDLFEALQRRYPTSVRVLTDLGTYYQYAQRPDDYTRTLEELRKVAPTEALLRDLSNIYNFNGKYREQIDVLRELAERGWATSRDLVSIVYLYASLGLQDKSIAFVDGLLAKPGNFNAVLAELKLRLLFDTGKAEQGAQFARVWVNRLPVYATAQTIAGLYQTRGLPPGQLIDMVASLRSTLDNSDPRLDVLYASILLDANRVSDAQAVLDPLISSNTLTDDGWAVAIRAAIGGNDLQAAKTYVTAHPDAALPDIMSYALEISLQKGDLASAATFAAHIPAESRLASPVLWARYAVLRNDPADIEKWITTALAKKTMAFADRYELAMLLNDLGRTRDLLPVLDQLAQTTPANGDIFSLASLYVALGEASHGLPLLSPALQNNPLIRNQAAQALLNAATGHGDLARQWLAQLPPGQLDADLLSTLYTTAMQGKAFGFAQQVASEINRRQPRLENRLLVLDAIWRQNDIAGLTAALDNLSPQDTASPQNARILSQFMMDVGLPARAYALAGRYRSDFATQNDLKDVWVQAALTTGHLDDLYTTLATLDADPQKLSIATFGAYVEAANSLGKTASLEPAILARYGDLPGWLRSLLIDGALDGGNIKTAQAYLQREADLNGSDMWFYLASARAGFADHDYDTTRKMLQQSLRHIAGASPTSLLQMARIWQIIGDHSTAITATDQPPTTAVAVATTDGTNGTARLDKETLAALNQIADALRLLPSIDATSLPETALLFRSLNRLNDGGTLIARVAGNAPGYEARLAQAILAINAQTPVATRTWIANYDWKLAQTGDLATLQGLASQSGDVTTEILATRKQLDLAPTDRRLQFALADAQLRAGNVEQALALARALPHDNEDYRNLYIEALRQSIGKAGPGRSDLIALLSQDLNDSTEPRKTQIIYDLIGLNAYGPVLPELEKRAELSLEWGNYYFDALSALGRPKDALAFLSRQAASSEVNDRQRQEIAYRLLGAGEKTAAEIIFRDMAAKSGPDSEAAKTLLFLWGPRLTDKQADWMSNQIANSTGKTRLGWLEIAGNAFAPARATALLAKYAPKYANNNGYISRLIAAYQKSGDRAALLGLLDDQRVRAANDKTRLTTLLAASQAGGFESLTQQIARRLTVIDRTAAEPYRILGQLAYGKEQFETASSYLERYLSLVPTGDYESYYYLAESADRLGRKKSATTNYRKSLELLQRQPDPTFYMRHLEGLILQRLQRYDDAVAIFTRLLRDNPNDAGVIADIAETRLLQRSPQRALQRVRRQ
ncbi:tetratricopeptide repeat protein [Thalassospira mesophila]|uniref:tetratricopeptide repeat protein n=1 Tax=Thalassospira mesophila TaxID=1293891 RepID=UPI00117C5B90|nr:tetratricopeptide repeat protein [Thalassospira mesophila]